MKIAIVISNFLPKWVAGSEVATLNIAQHLVALGHNVHIVTSRDEGMPYESVEGGIHLHRIYRPPSNFTGRAIAFWLIAFWLSVLYSLSRVKPHIIHFQGDFLGPCGYFAKRLYKRPYVVWSRGYGPKTRARTRATATYLKDADAVIASTNDIRQELQKIWPREISVIPNGIDAERFERVSREDARFQLGIEPAEKIVLFVGRFFPVKGVKYLIAAMPRVRHKEPLARLMLIGSGPEEEELRMLVDELGLSECIHFVGAVQNDSIPAYMVASDVLVLPSLSEGFPMVTVEAMAASLPIVTTDVRGIPSIVEDGINGFLVKPKDAAQIADKVSFILGDPELRRVISTNNKKKAQHYTWDRVVHDLERVYSKCIGP